MKAYEPKIAEFRLYCDHYYKQDAMTKHQVTKSKVESYLTYCFFREIKPRGRRKRGSTHGGIYFDFERANEIIKVYQSAQVNPKLRVEL